MSKKEYYTHILTNKTNKTLYVGVTGNLLKRIWEHKNKLVEGFTHKYNLNKLIYFEICNAPEVAIAREKQLKNWKRQWKIDLIRKINPDFNDLSEEWFDSASQEIPGQARNDKESLCYNRQSTKQ